MIYDDQDLIMDPYLADDEKESKVTASQKEQREMTGEQRDQSISTMNTMTGDRERGNTEAGFEDEESEHEKYRGAEFGPRQSISRRRVDYSIKPMSMIDESDMYSQEEGNDYECHPRVHKRAKYDMEAMDDLDESDVPSEAQGEISSQFRGPVDYAIRLTSEILADSVVKQEIIYPPGLISIERVGPSYASVKCLVKLADDNGCIKYEIQFFDEVKKSHGTHKLFAPFLETSGISRPTVTEQFVMGVRIQRYWVGNRR